MKKKRMRYRWWTDRPRNVTQREYGHWQLLVAGALVTGFLSIGSLMQALINTPLPESETLAQTQAMSVADAARYQGESLELVKLEGFLVSDDAVQMPDNESQTVIRGELELTARKASSSDDILRESLFEWTGNAESVFLSDGEAQIPLAFEVVRLPLPEADVDWEDEPNVEKTGDSARTSKPTAVTYGGMTFPLDPEKWGATSDTVIVDVTRSALPYGASAVIIAGLETTNTGNQLIDPLGDRLLVKLGTEADFRATGKQTRRMFAIIWIPFAIACFFLSRSARRYYQELVEISNQD